ncbi:MAG: hypothetical protein ACR2HF_03765 [Methylococcaceae bacterium]
MFVLQLLALGGLTLAGVKAIKNRKNKIEVLGKATDTAEVESDPVLPAKLIVSPERVRRDMRLSGVALGLSVSGVLLSTPLLVVMSLPSILCVATPIFQGAIRELRQRRVESDSQRTVRLITCLAAGLYSLAALDLILQMAKRRKEIKTEKNFSHQLATKLGHSVEHVWVSNDGAELEMPLSQVTSGTAIILNPGDMIPFPGVVTKGKGRMRPMLDTGSPGEAFTVDDAVVAGFVVVEGTMEIKLQKLPVVLSDVRQELEQAVSGKTELTQMCVETGSLLSPWMMGAFLMGLPFLGLSRTAVFLTTRMGLQMDTLGPHTSRQVIMTGLENGLFIRDLAAMERANTINTIVFDCALLSHPSAKGLIYPLLASLRSRHWSTPVTQMNPKPFAIYVVVDNEETGKNLMDTYGFDDYFNEPLEWGRTRAIKSLQLTGRKVCYVGLPGFCNQTMTEATLSVAWCLDGIPKPSAASILLGQAHLRDLSTLFDLARAFVNRQGANFLVPLGVDFMVMSICLFLSNGLFYSILLSNTAALIDVSGAGFVKRESLSERTETEPTPAH